MGLAASQARFLCITARKADCEYKTTALAQEKLDITKQLGDISNQYAQAMNATKLVWSNEAVDSDYGLTYSLMMMPTAANDYNPYMITSPSGAIVLNNEYAAAAKAAGISKAGGIGSQASRDKFIAALAHGGLITNETAKAITKFDFEVTGVDAAGKLTFNDVTNVSASYVDWNPATGMGADPLEKAGVQALTLSELCLTSNIGQAKVDWAKMFVDEGQMTSLELDSKIDELGDILSVVNNNQINKDVVDYLKREYNTYQASTSDTTSQDYIDKCQDYEDKIYCAENFTSVDADGYILSGKEPYLDKSDNKVKNTDFIDQLKEYIKADIASLKAIKDNPEKVVSIEKLAAGENGIDYYFNIDSGSGNSLSPLSQYNIIENGIINHYSDEVTNMTIADILAGNIVLMAPKDGGILAPNKSIREFREEVLRLFDSIAATLGYSKTEDLYGTGLYVDEASKNALAFAYSMIENTYLSTNKNSIQDIGSRNNKTSMLDNSAYLNAEGSNRIAGNQEYHAVSLSNMLSAFLTYYDNALAGINSPYVVGVTTDTSDYVTDNLDYYYMAQVGDDSNSGAAQRAADFYDQIYNNILEHGWREDAAIDDGEYLEAALKDGRYSMTSLNQDGYHYQTRYNETGYMVEVSDTDAIARAEAEFTAMKAQLTYKEDTIDMKTKKLDAEISALSTEYDTVKNLISKSIEKTFTMFQN